MSAQEGVPEDGETEENELDEGGKPVRTVRLDLEFDGAEFAGWQRQARDRTVQGVVEEALARLLGAPTPVAGAGRTDAGVHARRMTASFSTQSLMPVRAISKALDAILPEDVGVLRVVDASPGFHARRDARWKWYRYAWCRSRERRVFLRRSAWRVGARLDVAAMHEGARALLGRRDFACFQSSGSPRHTTVRTLAGLALSEDGEMLYLDAAADGFLYGMVRAISGTLAEVGRGARTAASLGDLLASKDRTKAGSAAPAHALTLMDVGYPGDHVPSFVDPSLRGVLESGSAAGPGARVATSPP